MSDDIFPAFGSSLGPETGGVVDHQKQRGSAWLFLFQMGVAVGLLVVFVRSPMELWEAPKSLPLSVWVAAIYALLALVGALFHYAGRPTIERQIQIAVFLDIVAFTLLMQQGERAWIVLGLLLAIAIAAGALLMEGRLSLLFASFATLGVIAQQVWAELSLRSPVGSLTQAGLLGITFFTVALLGHVLYRRIQQTEQLAAERQVDFDNLSELNELIIQSMGTGVLVLDQEQRLRLINGAAIRLLGLPPPALGQRLRDLIPTLADWLSTWCGDPHFRERSGSIQVGEQELKPSCRPLGEGARAGLLVFLRDNRELAREAQQIKLASLGSLTASIAHNIRNPLGSISHAGQLLSESPSLHPEDQELLAIIRRNSRRINDTVESVLQLSRRDQTSPERIELGTWLRDFCAELRETRGLSEERLQLRVPEAALTAEMDPRHLHQILSNLCDNALKHAGAPQQPARIRVLARADPERDAPLIEVADEGPGIDPAIAREIFDPFFSTSSRGTGLGLYIAKALSETNGAELQYIAHEGRGSRFRLGLPTRSRL
jgi:two-component system, NtrC family, sensor histidine kinase PilS